MLKTSVVEATLTALDRCDRCGAAARVRTVLATGDLLFCGHHARQAGPAISSRTISIYDPEGHINAKQ